MKTIYFAMILVFAMCSLSFAKDFETSKCGDECMQIKTRGGPVYRIHACGKLEKLEWKELNPNEEGVSAFDIETIGLYQLSDGVIESADMLQHEERCFRETAFGFIELVPCD